MSDQPPPVDADGDGPPPSRVTVAAPGRRSWLLAILLLLGALLVAPLLYDNGSMLSGLTANSAALVELIRGWGSWGVVGSLGLMVAHSFVPFPAEFLAIANGMVYGVFWGTVITWSGALLGALLAFGLARRFGHGFVMRKLGEPAAARLEAWSRESGWSTLLGVRLVPVIAFNLINYAAGLTPVSWWTFAWTTALGILPLTLLMVLLGDQMTALPNWAWGALLVVAGLAWWLLQRLQHGARRAPR